MSIPLNEIFGPTIQGEGSDIGKPTMFLRTFGCDFDCTWCDTRYAVDLSSGVCQQVTEKYILDELLAARCRRVVISGGNPLLHDLSLLIGMLNEHGFEIHVETQGSIYKDYLTKVDKINISPKGPSAGDLITTWNMLKEFLQELEDVPKDIKIVVFTEADYDYARSIYTKLKKELGMSFKDKNQFILQQGTDINSKAPRDQILRELGTFVETVTYYDDFEDDVRILPQLHTLIWNTERGY
ncbi:MAG: radical SAM protein [Halanaerobiales bacterium]